MSRTCSVYLGHGFAIMQRGAALGFRSSVSVVVAQFCVFARWMSRILSMHTYRCRKGAYSAGATSTWEVESYARGINRDGLKRQRLERGKPTGTSTSAIRRQASNTVGTAAELWAKRVT